MTDLPKALTQVFTGIVPAKPVSVAAAAPVEIDFDAAAEVMKIDYGVILPKEAPKVLSFPKPGFELTDDQLIARMDRSFGLAPSAGVFLGAFAGKRCAICGSGASIADAETIRTLRRMQKDGVCIIAVNKTIDFLAKRFLKVDIGVLCDPQKIVATYVKRKHPQTRFFIASQCHDDVFTEIKKLSPHVYVWHAVSSGPESERKGLYERETKLFEGRDQNYWIRISGGTTVGLRTMFMAFAFQFGEINLLGFDSSFRNGKLYGVDKPNANLNEIRYVVKSREGEQVFTSNQAMARQAAEFTKRVLELAKAKVPIADILVVHGTGAIPYQAALFGMHANPAYNAVPSLAAG